MTTQGQIAFHYRDDATYRVIGRDVAEDQLRVSHFAYDLADARQDVSVVFPLSALRDLAQAGFIGDLTEETYTFMGGIYSARRVREELAPALVARMIEQEADVALLVPV